MIPKFRAWDTFHNKWVKHFYITENGLIYNMEQPHRDLIGAVPIEQSGLIVMQSTELFDKNGKEIFEGDVVKLRYTISSDYEFFKVTRFRGGSWRIDNRRRGCELWLRNEECEIIGNIYENPELVEGSS
ncbi:TPA: YopX family protein [Streptococcus suis]